MFLFQGTDQPCLDMREKYDMNDFERAASTFKEGFNCSQSVFSTFAPRFGISFENALLISSPFGGGIGRAGEACGALTGALMALGLKFGFSSLADKSVKDTIYRITKDAVERFRAVNGSMLCRDLLGCAPGSPEGMARIKELNLHETVCTEVVRSAVRIVSEMLEGK